MSNKKLLDTLLGVAQQTENYQFEYKCQRCNSLNIVDYLPLDMMNFQSFITRIKINNESDPKIIKCSKCKKTTIQILVSFTQEHEKNAWDLKQKAMTVPDDEFDESIDEDHFLSDSQRLKNKMTRKGSDLFKS